MTKQVLLELAVTLDPIHEAPHKFVNGLRCCESVTFQFQQLTMVLLVNQHVHAVGGFMITIFLFDGHWEFRIIILLYRCVYVSRIDLVLWFEGYCT